MSPIIPSMFPPMFPHHATHNYDAFGAQEACTPCAGGTYQTNEGASGCDECPRGAYCVAGASAPVPCRGGTYGTRTGLSLPTECTQVGYGFWAPEGSVAPRECPPRGKGYYCPGAAADEVRVSTFP